MKNVLLVGTGRYLARMVIVHIENNWRMAGSTTFRRVIVHNVGTIDNFIVRLRRLIEPDPRNPRYIHTVRGTGYRLTP